MAQAQDQPKHKHRHRPRRLLTWDAAAVPDGGAAVYASCSALSLSYGKDAAGHPFHLAALKQAGLYGERAARAAPRLAAGVGSRDGAARGLACRECMLRIRSLGCVPERLHPLTIHSLAVSLAHAPRPPFACRGP